MTKNLYRRGAEFAEDDLMIDGAEAMEIQGYYKSFFLCALCASAVKKLLAEKESN